jgi:DNA polymerase-3 subunit delta
VRIKAPDLANQLGRTLAPVYTVYGEELLLALEAADAVRATARKKGFSERTVLEPSGRAFDWSELDHAGASQSLFGERKIVELRLTSGKVGAPAAQALVRWCGNPNPDALLLVTMPRPEGPGWRKSDWFTAVDRVGVIVEAEAVGRAALPGWLKQRLARQKQSASPEALDYLAARVEGNLLAAHQEVQKLALLAPEGELALDTVQDAVANVARFDPYRAAEALISGDLARYARILDGLRGEGESEVFVLYALTNTLFTVKALEEGMPAEAAFRMLRLYDKPLQRVVQNARNLKGRALEEAIDELAEIDRCIKGVGERDPWEGFITLGLKLAGGSKG